MAAQRDVVDITDSPGTTSLRPPPVQADHPPALSLSSSSSSSASSPPLTCSSRPPADTDITLDSVHQFSSYDDLKRFIHAYVLARGFEARWDTKGGENSMQQHGGNAHCWCSEKPPADGKADKKVTPQQLTNAARGCVKSACQWKVCWGRHTVTVSGKHEWVWHLTPKRVLDHNHPLLQSPNVTAVHSLRHVPPEMERLLRRCLSIGMTGESKLRRLCELETGCEVDHSVFHNLLNQVKHSMGVSVLSCGEFKLLLAWLEEEQDAQRAYARYDITEDREVCRVMYMSRDCAITSSATAKSSSWTRLTKPTASAGLSSWSAASMSTSTQSSSP